MKIKKTTHRFLNNGNALKIEGYNYFIELFGIQITMLFGDKNVDKFDDFVDCKKNISGSTHAYLNNNNKIVLAFKDNPSINTIVHECVHATNFVLQYIEHYDIAKNDEVTAYLTAHLVDAVMKAEKMYKKVIE